MGSAELLLFGGLILMALAVFGVVYTLINQGQVDKSILSWASGNEPVQSKSPLINWSRPLMHQFTLKYAVRIQNATYRKRVEKLILASGLSRELNTDEFIGLQIFWGGFVPVAFAVMNFALEMGFPWVFIVLMIPFGATFPHLYAKGEKKKREVSVRADLPFFADILALSTKAGLDFIPAIQKIVDKAEKSVLAEELGIVLKDIKLGSSRADALKAMSSRLDIPEITSFVSVLVDADAMGASIYQVLMDQSEQIRLERFVRAEKAGARASQAILFPMVLFIMPAVMIVVFGPVIIQFLYGGR